MEQRDETKPLTDILFAHSANEAANDRCASSCSDQKPGIAPLGQTASKVACRKQREQGTPAKSALALPEPDFGDQEFIELWHEFVAHTRELKKPLTVPGAKVALQDLRAWGPERAKAAIRHSIKSGFWTIYQPQNKAFNSRTPRADRRRSSKCEVLEAGKFVMSQNEIAHWKQPAELDQHQRLYDQINELWAAQVRSHADKGRPMTPATHQTGLEQIQDIVRRRGFEVAIASLRKTLQGGYLRIAEETEDEQVQREANELDSTYE